MHRLQSLEQELTRAVETSLRKSRQKKRARMLCKAFNLGAEGLRLWATWRKQSAAGDASQAAAQAPIRADATPTTEPAPAKPNAGHIKRKQASPSHATPAPTTPAPTSSTRPKRSRLSSSGAESPPPELEALMDAVMEVLESPQEEPCWEGATASLIPSDSEAKRVLRGSDDAAMAAGLDLPLLQHCTAAGAGITSCAMGQAGLEVPGPHSPPGEQSCTPMEVAYAHAAAPPPAAGPGGLIPCCQEGGALQGWTLASSCGLACERPSAVPLPAHCTSGHMDL